MDGDYVDVAMVFEWLIVASTMNTLTLKCSMCEHTHKALRHAPRSADLLEMMRHSFSHDDDTIKRVLDVSITSPQEN